MKYSTIKLAAVQPSASAAVSESAAALKAAGHDVIDLGLGEPDFDTPLHIKLAAHQAALAGRTKYPPTDGTQDLKAAIIAKLARDNGLTYAANEIIVANGAKQVIFDAFMASVEPGDQVLLLAPYFGSYKDIVMLLGGVPVAIPCPVENGFRLSPAALDAAITPATRWLLINSPSNPAGAVYDEAEFRALGEVLLRHPHVLIMSDEIYEHILFDGRTFASFSAACPQLRDRTLVVNGVSKAYAMTGWRIGYGAGPKPLIAGMTKVQSQISSGACSIAQAAAAAALDGPQGHVALFRAAFERRRDLIVSRIAGIPGLSLNTPGGAFYALIGCASFIGAKKPDGSVIADDIQFTQYLLLAAKVAAVPGSAYGLSSYFRISTATADHVLAKAMDRIATCVAHLEMPRKDS